MEMQTTKPLHHLLVTVITQGILAIGAIFVLLPTGLLGRVPWGTMGFLFSYNVIIATLVGLILMNASPENRNAVLKGGGLVLGHLVGLVLGAFLGALYGGAALAIVGAAVLYFVVGWIGSKISFTVGGELEKLSGPAMETDAQKLIRCAARRRTNSTFLVGAVVPAVFLAAAVFVKSSGLDVAQYPAVLPTARIALSALSLLAMISPWLRGALGTKRLDHRRARSSRASRHRPRPLAGPRDMRVPAVRWVWHVHRGAEPVRSGRIGRDDDLGRQRSAAGVAKYFPPEFSKGNFRYE